MALSPTIPTSFVPKQPVSPGSNRPRSSGVNYFLIAGFIIGGGAILASGAVFAYNVYLGTIEKEKGRELVAAQQSISQNHVAEFVRLKNRLTAAKTVLNEHIAASQFFTFLEANTVTDVSFSSLTIEVASDRTATIQLSGVARNFNALASESTIFASNKLIKSAIFSGISLNSNSSVGFTINASVDPSMILQKTAMSAAPAILTASTTPQPVPSVSALSTTTVPVKSVAATTTTSTTTATSSKP